MGGVTSFGLVHSPLVGPATWRAVADELRGRGHEVTVPSLVGAAQSGDPHAVVDAAAHALHDIDVLVGHSGAGLLLPLIAHAMNAAPAQLVFVDSAIPPASGTTPLLPDRLRAHIAPLAVDGTLPPWSEWFGADAMPALVPDPIVRAGLVTEMPRLPLAYFDTAVAMPEAWRALDCGYVLLSAAYVDDAREAARLGWPLVELRSTHLAIATDAHTATNAIVAVVTAPRDGSNSRA